ncbi:helix-turn-helix domain-containing protein [Trinickia sp. EG282A]|uniref:helix-turn-helix domain-containing protein n=1 Tax=Trinickia sp. EG282A TaxID=3237013 RepID=UPI0034D22C91
MKIIVKTPAQMAEILLSARKIKGLTQAEAAARLGTGQPRLSALETVATGSISLDQILALLALYDLDLCVQSRDGKPSGASSEEPEW